MWWKVGAISGMSAVVFGAFGSHGLRNKVGARELEVWDTAVKYQLYHSLAILIATMRGGPAGPRIPCALFTAGIAVFSGSLYALVLSGERRLGAVTPIGGTLFIAGWLALAFM
jgi:uncharacterized membrane protein YgdD (TMEM256/DUF423 family)